MGKIVAKLHAYAAYAFLDQLYPAELPMVVAVLRVGNKLLPKYRYTLNKLTTLFSSPCVVNVCVCMSVSVCYD